MIYIGICDDDKAHQKFMKDEVFKMLFSVDDVEFSCYSSGDAVKKAIEKDDFRCELLFLDIHMPGISGIELADYIRRTGVDVDIIFITISREHVFDGYTYRAFSYLLKPLDTDKLGSELDRYISMRNSASNCLHVNINGKKVQILLDRVKYFSSDAREIIVHDIRDDDEITFYAKMNELEETLKEFGFLRCHQSYLVNPKFVRAHSASELDVNGDAIPVSRRYSKILKEYFENR